ncbi:MAG: 50S ribosomal protein L17 [Chlamydiales bacterium]
MRHLKKTQKLGRTSSHKRCLIANMLKSLIIHGRIQTTVAKAKVLRSYADRMVTLAKKDDLNSRRRASEQLMIRYNKLTPKEQRAAKNGNIKAYNDDRKVINQLFGPIKTRFESRQGGYTRIVRKDARIGDNAETCYIEYLPE